MKPVKSSLYIAVTKIQNHRQIFVSTVTWFTRSALRLFKIHRRQPSWISGDRPILGESS